MSVSTSSTDPVQAIYDILNDATTTSGGYGLSYGYLYGGADTWTNTAPEVHQLHNKTQKYRENNDDPALYVWSPDASSRPAFSADYDHVDEQQFITVAVWTLAEQDTLDYAGDVLGLLEEYGTDNKGRTEWTTIRPSADNDLRAEHITRRTDHYVITIPVDLRAYRATGMVA